jgi:hypothetical protein
VSYGSRLCPPFSRGYGRDDGTGAEGAFFRILLRGLQRKLLGEMAAGKVAGTHFSQQRRLCTAAVLSEPAARMKIAAQRRCSRTRHLAPEDRTSAGNTRIRNRDGAHQRGRVGMTGTGEDRFGCRQFDDLADIHDRDAVRDVAHHGEVVRHKNERQPQPQL